MPAALRTYHYHINCLAMMTQGATLGRKSGKKSARKDNELLPYASAAWTSLLSCFQFPI
jgi:hypothetical protein